MILNALDLIANAYLCANVIPRHRSVVTNVRRTWALATGGCWWSWPRPERTRWMALISTPPWSAASLLLLPRLLLLILSLLLLLLVLVLVLLPPPPPLLLLLLLLYLVFAVTLFQVTLFMILTD